MSSFPSTSISMQGLSILDNASRARIASAEKTNLSFNPFKLLIDRSNIRVIRLEMIQPDIQYQVNDHGVSNWDNIINGLSDSEEPENSNVSFEVISVSNGTIDYSNKQSNTALKLRHMAYEGNLKFGRDSIFHTVQSTAKLSASQSKFFHFTDYDLLLHSMVKGHMSNQDYQFENSILKVNDMELALAGDLNLEDLLYNISFQADEQKFDNLLSLLQCFQGTEHLPRANGSFDLNGRVSGGFEKSTYPTYQFSLNTTNATVDLNDKSTEPTEVDMSISIRNSSPSTLYEKIEIPSFRIVQGAEMVEGNMEIERKYDELYVDHDLQIAISDISKFGKLTTYDLVKGKVAIESHGKFNTSDLQKEKYDKVQFSLNGEMEDITIQNESTRYTLKNANISGDQSGALLNLNDLSYNRSDLSGAIKISNPLKILLQEPEINADLDLSSNHFDLNAFLHDDPNVDSTGYKLPLINGHAKVNISKLTYRSFPISDVVFDGIIAHDKLSIGQLKAVIRDSDLSLSGNIVGLSDYLENKGTLNGVLDVQSDEFHLSQLQEIYMDSTFGSYTDSSTPLFHHLDIQVIGDAQLMTYQKSTLQNNLVSFRLKDNQLIINDITSNSLGGKLQFNGLVTFDNREIQVDIKSNFNDISISQSLRTLPVFEKLAHPLSFIEGRINTTINLQSLLDKDYNLILPKVDAFGLLETIDGKVIGFKPLEVLSNYLGLQKSKEVLIKQSKNWVTIKDGWVQVDEFNFKMNDSNFKVHGAHSLTNELDYRIQAEIPSRLLSQISIDGKVGAKLAQKIDKFRDVPSGYIGLYFEMTGTFDSPVIRLNDVDILSAGKAAAREALEEVKDTLRSTVGSLKSKIETGLKDSLESLSEVAKDKIGSAIDSIKIDLFDRTVEEPNIGLNDRLDSLGYSIPNNSVSVDSMKKGIFDLKKIFKREKK